MHSLNLFMNDFDQTYKLISDSVRANDLQLNANEI